MKKEIICTLGPSSMNRRIVKRLEDIGIGLFRINLSHTKLGDLARVIRFIKGATSVPICLDTEGAQVRTGRLTEAQVNLEEDAIVRIPRRGISGSHSAFNLYPHDVVSRLRAGDLLSIDFNCVLARVIDVKRECARIKILCGGRMGSNKAVSIDRDIYLEPFTDKDKKAFVVARENGVRHAALSFASSGRDIEKTRRLLGKGSTVIAKIESIKGIMNFEEIAKRADAVILDRGDLSREIPIEHIPMAQKDLIKRAKKIGRKFYVATNLLESMTDAPTPTRAEVNDIFNTLADGADGLVLAAETAVGLYPIQCASMVSRMIKQFSRFSNSYSMKELCSAPIGNFNPGSGVKRVNKIKTLEVDTQTIMDAEQLALGAFSPLEGFMAKKDVVSVIGGFRLTSGAVWPLPILLQIDKDEARRIGEGEKIALKLKNTNDIHAYLTINEIYRYDLDKMAKGIFGTGDKSHPGVSFLKNRGDMFIGGNVELARRLVLPCSDFELTPRQSRAVFENKGWSRVVGFHTRNVIHKVHEHIQMLALEKYNCDGLFVHPIIGFKKQGDYNSSIILKSYELMLKKYYPKGKVVLSAFKNYSRYAGPREAVFTALCRKNYGCSHFIVGRDHTGLLDYYGQDDAKRLFDKLGDIGITPIFFDEVRYCKACRSYTERCRHANTENSLSISASAARGMLKEGKLPPGWFMRRDIADFVLKEIENGNEVFVK